MFQCKKPLNHGRNPCQVMTVWQGSMAVYENETKIGVISLSLTSFTRVNELKLIFQSSCVVDEISRLCLVPENTKERKKCKEK